MSGNSLQSRILSFLETDDRLSLINFGTHGNIINKESFREVAKAISSGHIRIKGLRLAKAGEYWIKENIMAIDIDAESRGGTEFFGIVVHEAIHAYQDILARPMSVAAGEYVAFIAQSIFEVTSGRRFGEGEDHDNHFAVQLARLYKGEKVPYTSHQLAEHFSKEILPAIKDSHGKGLYDAKGVYPMDGVSEGNRGRERISKSTY